uniref:Neural cell adhesion molecule 1a n=1 Tax=Amphiprion ocellaris TaxID=80972 RepID=A0A3Q1D4U0_AMPOC
MYIFVLSSFLHPAAIQVQITPTQGEISIGESKFFLCEGKSEFKRTSFNIAGYESLNVPLKQPKRIMEVHMRLYLNSAVLSCPSNLCNLEYLELRVIRSLLCSPLLVLVRFKILSNGHLQIRGIKKTDEGMYNCEARVTARGEIDFRMMKVIVNVLPTIRARQSEVNATADVGSSALLACDADGFPEPTVTWAHNNVVLETGDKYSLNGDGSELEIKDVKKVDEGDYTCIAKNKAGEKTEEVSLNVFVQPKITFLINQSASEFDEQVTLTCEASGDPTPAISWSFGNRVFTEGEQSLDRNVVVRSHARVSSLTLKNVQFTYAGQYLCTASNSIGQDNRHMYLEVRYAPKILGSVTVYTWEGNPANISCEVDAHPGAEVVWFRDGLQLPNANTTNMKVYNTPTISYLEVCFTCCLCHDLYCHTKDHSTSVGQMLEKIHVPSSPEIQQVEPFSSTAVVEFEEPVSMGGVPIIKYRVQWRSLGQEWTGREYDAEDDMTRITIVGLKPETTYEVKMSAINGKGEGESSTASTFKTQPVSLGFISRFQSLIRV